jgi:hypothetical protein
LEMFSNIMLRTVLLRHCFHCVCCVCVLCDNPCYRNGELCARNSSLQALRLVSHLCTLCTLTSHHMLQKRYHVKRVIEFYAATEGNANLFNSTGKAGPLGYVPVWVANLVYPIK